MGKGDFVAFLAARGRLGQDDRRDFAASGGNRLFLTEAGYLTYEELVEESRLFLVHRLTTALEAAAPAHFAPGDSDLALPLVPLSTLRFLAEAARTGALCRDTELFFSAYGEHFPARTTRFFRRINLISLRQDEIALLERIDGKTPLREIVAGSVAAAEAAGFFTFLRALRMVELHHEPTAEAVPDFFQKNLFNRPLEESHSVEVEMVAFDDLVEEVAENVGLAVGEVGMAAPLSSAEIGFEQEVQRDYAFIQEKNYYEMFGLTPSSFNFDALKEAYFAKSRHYSAEKFMELGGATMTMAQDVLARYADAYNTLSSVVAKERYDELLNADRVGLDGKKDDKLQAQVQFQSGNVFLEMGEYDNAEKSLQDAYTIEPGNPLHCAWLAWAIYKNPANRSTRATQERARTLLAKSLQSGKSAEAYAFRGWMLFDEGRDGLAEGEFQKALKLNPKEPHARQGLKLLLEKRETEKKGVFRRLFG
jgi:tetratricopeptide (TPR) repeat protein